MDELMSWCGRPMASSWDKKSPKENSLHMAKRRKKAKKATKKATKKAKRKGKRRKKA